MKTRQLLILILAAPLTAAAALAAAAPPGQIAFEPNRGQAPGGVAFLARTSSVRVYASDNRIGVRPHNGTDLFEITLKGGRDETVWRGEQLRPGVSHYLRGRAEERWITGVARYGRIRLPEVYPGVDLIVYGANGLPEFDFEVAPGAGVAAIQLSYSGGRPRLSDDGSLLLTTAEGELRQHPPVVYQPDGDSRRPVAGRYQILDSGLVAFEIGPHDDGLPLVIDPVLSYGTFIGTGETEKAQAIALGGRGQACIAGAVSVRDSPDDFFGDIDALVSCLSEDGSTLLWQTHIGGWETDIAAGIAVDSGGFVYVAGTTEASDFPTTPGALQEQPPGGAGSEDENLFILKLTPNGESLIYSTYLGGSGSDYVSDLAIDSGGNVHVAGVTISSDWPTTAGALQPSACGGNEDGFYARLSPSGKALTNSTYLCGSGSDAGTTVTVDAEGNAFVGGQTDSADFPRTGEVRGRNGLGRNDVFVNRFDAHGPSRWSVVLGGTQSESPTGIALDRFGAIYVSGYTRSTDLPVTGGVVQNRHSTGDGSRDLFVFRLEPGGKRFTLGSYLGGSGNDTPHGMAVDHAGRILLAGTTESPDFPIASSPCLTGYRGAKDAFLVRLTGSAQSVGYGLFLGGTEDDEGLGMAVDGANNALITGSTRSLNFPTTSGAHQPAYQKGYGGGMDAFIAKVGPGLSPTAPCIAVNGVLNNGSMLPAAVSPGEIVTIFGDGIGPAAPALAEVSGNRLAVEVAGARALFDGVPASMIFAYRNQVAAIVPYSVEGKSKTTLVLEYMGARTASVELGVVKAAPAILTQNSSGTGPGAILNSDYSLNNAANPAAAGSVVMIYATGEGQTQPPGRDGMLALGELPKPLLPVRVFFDHREAEVLYAGAAPGLVAGVLQVNVRVPPGLRGETVPVTLVIGEARSRAGVTAALR